MTKIPSVEETEETAKAIIEKVRHYATPHQHPDNSVEAKAYLEGVNTAMAMLYIDLTGTPKVKGFLTTYAETQRLALLTELREYVNQIAYHDDWDCHVLDYDKIKTHLDELIKQRKKNPKNICEKCMKLV